MAWDLAFDPVTRDLVDDGAGAFEITETAATAVMLQLISHWDAWWGDPDAGSLLHDLQRFASDPPGLTADESRRALQLLAERGRISNLEVIAEEPRTGRVNVAIRFRDTSTGQQVDLVVPAMRTARAAIAAASGGAP